MPFNANKNRLESLRIYRSFAFGNLMELGMTDERLYRDSPPCGLETNVTSRQHVPTEIIPNVQCWERTNGSGQHKYFLSGKGVIASSAI